MNTNPAFVHATRSKVTLPPINMLLLDHNRKKEDQPTNPTPSTNITSTSPDQPSTTIQSTIDQRAQNVDNFSGEQFLEKIQVMLCESEKRVTSNITEAFENRISSLEVDVKNLKSTPSNIDNNNTEMRMAAMEKCLNEMRVTINEQNVKLATFNDTPHQIVHPKNNFSNVIISGVPYKIEENLIRIVTKIFDILGFNANSTFTAFRLLKSTISTDSSLANSQRRYPKILVKLNSFEMKTTILQLKRNKNILSTELNIEGEPSKIYVSEQLTTETGSLFKKARELRDFGMKYVWTHNGNVLVKSDSKGKTVHVSNLSDIESIKENLISNSK